MRRPLLGVALAFIGGILLEHYLLLPPGWLLAAAGLTLIPAVASLKLVASRKLRAVAVLPFVLCTAAAYYASFVSGDSSGEIAKFAGPFSRIVKVRGRVTGLPFITSRVRKNGKREEVTTYRSSFPLDCSAILVGKDWQPTTGKIRVSIRDRVEHIRYGDEIELSCRLSGIRAAGNPGEFDPAAYFRRKGISARASAELASAATRVGAGRGPGTLLLRTIYGYKRLMRNYVDSRTEQPVAGLLKCVLLGDRGAVTDEQNVGFQRTGTVHFLAVSGLHIALVALSLALLLRLLKTGPRVSAALVMCLIGFYALMAGFRPSDVRAGVMIGTLYLAVILFRKRDLFNSLALAALVILVAAPGELFSVGFQLSFAAVIGIVALTPELNRFVFRRDPLFERLQAPEERVWFVSFLRRYGEGVLSISIAAWAAAMPLVAYHFNIVTPLTPIFNLFLTFLLWIVLLCGFPAVVLGPFLGGLVEPLILISKYSAAGLIEINSVLARIPHSAVYTAGPSVFWIIGYYILLTGFVLRKKLNIRLGRLCLAGLILAATYGVGTEAVSEQKLQIVVLDVGSGNANLVRFPDGGTLLYDGGSLSYDRVGERVLSRALWRLGVKKIDLLVASHAHADHWNGLPTILERFRVGKVILPRSFGCDGGGGAFTEALERSGVLVETVLRGDRIEGFPNAAIEVLHPFDSPDLWKRMTRNDRSCVLRIIHPSGTILLVADIEQVAIDSIVASGQALRCDVMLAPHHGYALKHAEGMLADATPSVVLVSSRRPDSHSALEGGPLILNTADEGCLTVEFAAEELRINGFRSKRNWSVPKRPAREVAVEKVAPRR